MNILENSRLRRSSPLAARPFSESSGVRIALYVLVFGLLALISLAFTRASGSAAALWLPNAAAIAAMIYAKPHRFPEIVGSLLVGICLAKLADGSSMLSAIRFGAVNGLEVIVGAWLCQTFLKVKRPHSHEVEYLKFLVLMTLTAAISGLFCGALLQSQFGMPPLSAYLCWSLGAAVSLIAFVPLFLWLHSVSESEFHQWFRPIAWTVLCAVAIAFVTVFFVLIQQEVHGLFALVLIVALLASQMSVTGTIFVTGFFACTIAVTSFAEQDLLIKNVGIGPSAKITAFVAIFLAVAVPGNLIASMVMRLRQAEERQRMVNRNQTEFIATMSHETMTPLNVITGVLQLLEQRELDERSRRLVETGQSAADAMSHQVQQYFTLATLQNERFRIAPRVLDGRQLLSQWVDLTKAEVSAKDKDNVLTVRSAMTGELPNVLADPDRLTQVLLNLSSNAVKFSDSGTIALSIRQQDDNVILSILDEGIGITAADQSSVFKRFWQGDDGRLRPGPGAGIGLAVCKELVQAMNGDVTVWSDKGKGARFDVSLPLALGQKKH